MRSAVSGAALLAAIIFGSLTGGLVLGGTLATGQAAPSQWLAAQAVALMLPGLLGVRAWAGWAIRLCAITGSLSAVALQCELATGILDWRELVSLAGVSAMALQCGAAIGAWRGWRRAAFAGLLLAGVMAAQFWRDRQPIPIAADRPVLGIVSALPLFWTMDGALGLRSTAPAVAVLERDFRVAPLDVLDAAALDRVDHLLVAQPRLLSPIELVALDGWVRGGGRAVILADPLLLWPMDLPPGDRRRPPVTSLLDPLLAHWGLRLEPVTPDGERIERRFLSTGALLPVAAASRFILTGGACAVKEDGLFALCRVGRGQARLVADADLLDDRLWLADPGRPLARRAWSGDSMALLADWLRAPLGPDRRPASRTAWVASHAALIGALRRALAAGLIWVVLGATLLRGREKPGGRGKDPHMPGPEPPLPEHIGNIPRKGGWENPEIPGRH